MVIMERLGTSSLQNQTKKKVEIVQTIATHVIKYSSPPSFVTK